MQSEDYGRHLLDVEDLLQKHSLIEADIAAQEDRIKVADDQANLFLEMEPEVEGTELVNWTSITRIQLCYSKVLKISDILRRRTS